MNTTAIFGLSSAMSLITGIVLANLYICRGFKTRTGTMR